MLAEKTITKRMPISFSRQPIRFESDIPFFSNANEYIKNYEIIAHDHVSEMTKTGKNPFIDESLWKESENATAGLIAKYSKANDFILDIGVGLGRILTKFPHLKRCGMDISIDYLKHAQKKGIQVCFSLIEDMPYQLNSFDIIVCTDVLEHVFDLNDCCKKILSVLKPSGILIIRTPFAEDLTAYAKADYPYKYAHLRTFDQNSLFLLFTKIFNCQVMETQLSGYRHYPRRFKYSSCSQFNLLTSFLMRCLRQFTPALYKLLVTKLYNPIEINMVIKKSN